MSLPRLLMFRYEEIKKEVELQNEKNIIKIEKDQDFFSFEDGDN